QRDRGAPRGPPKIGGGRLDGGHRPGLASNPGRIASEIPVTLPHPRDRLDPGFRDLVEKIYALMTQRPDPTKTATRETATAAGLGLALPRVSTNSLAGMLEE